MRVLCSVAASMVLAGVSLAAPPPVPETPAPVLDVVYARAFTLAEGFTFRWSAERPVVTEGTILVLDVAPELVYPRQVAEPVLYVGAQPAQRVSRGYPAGRVLALVPGRVDLAETPVFFGTPELPERVDAATGARELERAAAVGIRPLPRAAVDAALAQGGVTLTASDAEALDRELRDVFERFVRPLLP